MIYLVLLLVCGASAAWLAGNRLSAPARRAVAPPENLAVEPVSASSKSGARLKGWVIQPAAPRAVVVLLHGIRSSRFHMVSRARFLAAAGYAVVAFDFQAHGESEGERITFGYLERWDACAAVEFARERFGSKPIGVIGVSLGGAAALLAAPDLKADAFVLEAVFPTITDAVKDRIAMVSGRYTRWMHRVLTWQLKPRIGCGVEDLCPIEKVGQVTSPKLLVSGTRDRHTTIAETREMFRRAAEPKELWEVEGARHEDLHAFAPAEYERRVLGFFARNLR